MASENTTEPTEGFRPIISDKQMEIIQIVNHLTLSGIVCLIGIATNTINMVIFIKQGLSNTMNISFFAIAISDMCSLIPLEVTNVCLNPFMLKADVPFEPGEVQYLAGGWPHGCFTRITCWITGYITMERCLCVIKPLKVKQIITPTRTRIAVCLIYFLMALAVAPEYFIFYYGPKFNPVWNRTRIGLVPYEDRQKQLEGYSYVLYALITVLSFCALVFFTVLLVYKLKMKTKWRQMSTTVRAQNESNISARDKKAVKMVILISSILITCYTPSVILSVIVFIVPEFSLVGRYRNIFALCWSLVFLTEAINASVNIILYYNMSTKYRQTFYKLFPRCRNQNDKEASKSETSGETKASK